MLRARDELEILLDFCLIKRAVRDLYQELNNGAERIQVPLRALVRLQEARV